MVLAERFAQPLSKNLTARASRLSNVFEGNRCFKSIDLKRQDKQMPDHLRPNTPRPPNTPISTANGSMFESYDYANNEPQNRYGLAHFADGPSAEMAIGGRTEHASMATRLAVDLRAVSDHDVGITLRHVIEDCAVVGKFFALCVRKMRFGEGLLGPAGIGHDPHVRGVDRGD